MKTIHIKDHAGSFAEDKDKARALRLQILIPALKKGERVTIDFSGVDGVTQSFMHALISDLVRQFGNETLDYLDFKSCNETVQKIISIVVEYMQESL